MTTYATNPSHSDYAAQAGKGQEYEVLLVWDYEYPGYAVLCPSLGCASQGDAREEALVMIADAISMLLDSYAEDGLEPPFTPDATAAAAAEYQAEGCHTEVASVRPADWDAIIANCSAAIQRNPNDAKAYLERGGTYLNKREYDRAIEDYTSVIRIAPENSEAYTSRGNVYLSKNEYDQAIADYHSALRRDPYDEEALCNLEAAYIARWESARGK
ncbi:MAG: tetratricopeptide repeat protein [Chloroflexota bacterium]|nr:tetratricopeptide repeat protein [Chloroflexota bacterium]